MAWRTFIISIDISRIVALNCGSFTSWFVVFMISVDFWNAPVTLTIATPSRQRQRHGHSSFAAHR